MLRADRLRQSGRLGALISRAVIVPTTVRRTFWISLLGALPDALLLGRRETLDRALSDRFAKTGLVHLLAISGTHVALMGAVFVLIGRMLRLSRTRVAWLTIVLITLYLAVIGAPPLIT